MYKSKFTLHNKTLAMEKTASTEHKSAFKIILLTGFIAGTLDGTAATIQFLIKGGKDPGRIFKYISSAVFGPDAYNGGFPMILSGVVFHYIIAYSLTLFFFLIYHKMPILAKNKYITGICYGIFAWIVTTQIIVRLSLLKPVFHLDQAIIAMLILIAMIGLPISILANRFYSKK